MKDLKANTIKNASNQSQTVTYKGKNLTVYWGGEYYTAHYDGEVYRQGNLNDLKKDIANVWYVDLGRGLDDIKREDVQTCLLLEAQNLEGEKIELPAGDETLTVYTHTSFTQLASGTHTTTRWTIRDSNGIGSTFLNTREALRYLAAFSSYTPVLVEETQAVNTYYEITGEMDGKTEVLFGTFDKSEIKPELDAERDNWKEQGYKKIAKTSRKVSETPDPEVYAGGEEYKAAVCRALKHDDVTVSVGDRDEVEFDLDDSRNIGEIFEAVEGTDAPVVSFFKIGEFVGSMSVSVGDGAESIIDYHRNDFMISICEWGV